MDRQRYLIEYHNLLGPARLAPFLLWAESVELAEAYAIQWVGPAMPGEMVDVFPHPSGALAA
jgi:hypothetical protein